MAQQKRKEQILKILLEKVLIKEIMSKKVVSVDVDDHFSEVEKKMRENSVRHLPVLDMDKKVVGIISQRDLYRTRSPRILEDGSFLYEKETLDSYIISKVMTKNPFTLSLDSAVSDAIKAMADKKYGCIPIVDKNKVICGIITQYDLIKIAAKAIK